MAIMAWEVAYPLRFVDLMYCHLPSFAISLSSGNNQ